MCTFIAVIKIANNQQQAVLGCPESHSEWLRQKCRLSYKKPESIPKAPGTSDCFHLLSIGATFHVKLHFSCLSSFSVPVSVVKYREGERDMK